MNIDLTIDTENQPDPKLLQLDELLDQHRDRDADALAASAFAEEIDTAGLSEQQRHHLCLSAALFDALDEQKVATPDGFADQVMARVREQRQPGANWRSVAAVAAAIVGLVLVSALMFGEAGTDGLFGTLADVTLSAVTVGAGLLNASWKGAATLVGSWFETSPVTLFGALFGLLGAQAFAWTRIRRRASERIGSESRD